MCIFKFIIPSKVKQISHKDVSQSALYQYRNSIASFSFEENSEVYSFEFMFFSGTSKTNLSSCTKLPYINEFTFIYSANLETL